MMHAVRTRNRGGTSGAVLALVTHDPLHRDPSCVHPLPSRLDRQHRMLALAFILLGAMAALASAVIPAP